MGITPPQSKCDVRPRWRAHGSIHPHGGEAGKARTIGAGDSTSPSNEQSFVKHKRRDRSISCKNRLGRNQGDYAKWTMADRLSGPSEYADCRYSVKSFPGLVLLSFLVTHRITSISSILVSRCGPS